MDTNCYLIAIGDAEPTRDFNKLLEKFAPMYPLRVGVYVVFHSTLLSIPQLRKLVEDTLPSSVPFFVGICPEYDHVPSREVPEVNKPSDPA